MNAHAHMPKGQLLAPGNPPSRRERKSSRTRMAIFNAAIGLFTKREYSSVTSEDITEAADVGKGTFFNYFPTKAHVLCMLVELQNANIARTVESAHLSGCGAYIVLRDLMLQLVEIPGKSPEMASAYLHLFINHATRKAAWKELSASRQLIAGIVEYGQERGEIRRNLSPGTIVLRFQRTVLGTILFWLLNEKPSLAHQAEDNLKHFWWTIAVRSEAEEL